MFDKTTVNNDAKNLIGTESIKNSVVAVGDYPVAVGRDFNVNVDARTILLTGIEQKQHRILLLINFYTKQ